MTIVDPISTTNQQPITIEDEDLYGISSDESSESTTEADYDQKDRTNSDYSEDNRGNNDSYISEQIILTGSIDPLSQYK